MQAVNDFSTINGHITPGKRQNIRLQIGSFVLCSRHYDLQTSVAFHNKVISRLRTPRLTLHTAYAHMCWEGTELRNLWERRYHRRHSAMTWAPHGSIIWICQQMWRGSNIVCNQFCLDSTTNLPHSRTVTVASATPNAYAVIKALPESLR